MTDTTLSAAIKEAYASAPKGVIVYDTLEIWNASFSAPIRVVRDTVALTAMIEAGAPLNAGTMQTFAAYSFDLVRPELTTNSVPTCTIAIDNVDRVIGAQIQAAAISGQETSVIFRQYLSSGLATGPENLPPMTLTLMSVTTKVMSVEGVAGFPDLLNRRFPALDYDLETFPGLQP